MSNLNVNLQPENIVSKLKILANITDNNCVINEEEWQLLAKELKNNFYKNMGEDEIFDALILSCRTLIEIDPFWDKMTSHILLLKLENEVNFAITNCNNNIFFENADNFNNLINIYYRKQQQQNLFSQYIKLAVENGYLNPQLLNDFDLDKLSAALDNNKDFKFNYLGLQTLYDRYFLTHFLHKDEKYKIELPQFFFMRVAMGLAINETDSNKNDLAIEFYNLISNFDFMCSTPTLFNSGTTHSQLSSCYVSTIGDSLEDIFSGIKDNAMLQKYAGGVGNDWTNIRALGSLIKGTHGESQGVIPFLKVANDTAVAVNQGGKRKGAVCAYLEVWHLDIEEFIELRKNTGDERRRTHDMNTALWVPDLFMQRVNNDGIWTLFSPNEVADLHKLYGKEFEKQYLYYESIISDSKQTKIKLFKQIKAKTLWRKMLTQLFETGHPWITFKDSFNLRSPQQHVGVIHSSNLCTEIGLNTNENEIAVCNLGSVNLVNHLTDNLDLDLPKLQKTVSTAVRMLDNVIDINFYPVEKAKNSNLLHRPIGLGLMGFADCLQKMHLPFYSSEAKVFADKSMEYISYFALCASHKIAQEKGIYSTFKGSLWNKGILPVDTLNLVKQQRNANELAISMNSYVEKEKWEEIRNKIKNEGLRNSCLMAIAPTATIANIVGVSNGIEPHYQNLYVKSNLSGEFTLINTNLVNELKQLGIWNHKTLNILKQFDGSIQNLNINEPYKYPLADIFAGVFELDSADLIECAALRQKWIDQAQSLNIYLDKPSGKKLNDLYQQAWKSGLKSTYYLRTLGASQTEKNIIPNDIEKPNANNTTTAKFCSIDNPDCEACQ